MLHFYTWQQSKTCTPGLALINETKKLLLYAEYYVAFFISLDPGLYPFIIVIEDTWVINNATLRHHRLMKLAGESKYLF